jgi:farnesyl diphosphate synthase
LTAAQPACLAEFDLGRWMSQRLEGVELALGQWVGPADTVPSSLAEPMRYAVLDGGKRLRPLLVLAACEAVEGHETAALRAACAVELMHAYSLVHDDMPCMDNDVLRRGKPTVHVQFGQASAMLAGDALQALAFELLTPDDTEVPAPVQAQLCRMLARAAGGQGMAGGQAIDLAHVGQRIDVQQLHEMHRLKTGALLLASVQMGAHCGQPDGQAMAALSEYGRTVGLAFQVVDDILDVTADSQTLGKTAGKDAAQDKPTFVSLMGLRQSQNYAQELLSQAQASLRHSGLSDTRALQALADKLVNRAF